MPDVDLGEVARSLYARRHEAITVPFEMHSVVSGPPLEHDCHGNVDRFVLEHPDHKSVRGWLVFDFNKSSQGQWPSCRFTAHSVVETADGCLIDLTPSQASKRYPFLRDQGPEGQFEAIVLAGHIHLDCAVGVDDAAGPVHNPRMRPRPRPGGGSARTLARSSRSPRPNATTSGRQVRRQHRPLGTPAGLPEAILVCGWWADAAMNDG